MCKLLFIPAGVDRETALDILIEMYSKDVQPDGCGESYCDANGKLIVNKYKHDLLKVLKKGKQFLNHLPHFSWTAIHLRKASIGHVSKTNAQPFLSLNEKVSVCHNGSLAGTHLLSLYLSTCLNYEASSDSAAATEIISRAGLKDFSDSISWGGIFGVLNQESTLQIAKVSGRLGMHLLPNKKCIIATDFDETKYKSIELPRGIYRFDKDGNFKKSEIREFHWSGYLPVEKPKVETIKYENWNGIKYIHTQSGGNSFSHMARQPDLEYL